MDLDLEENNWTISSEPETTSEFSHVYIGEEVIHFVFCLLGVIGNGFLMYLIRKHRRLQVYDFVFLFNWAIADTGYLLLSSTTFRIFGMILNYPIYRGIWCVPIQLGYIMYNIEFVIMGVIAIDWCLDAYFPFASMKFKRNYKTILVFIWVSFLVYGITESFNCMFHKSYDFAMVFAFLTFLLLMLFIIIMQCIRCKRRIQKKVDDTQSLGLKVASIFVLTTFCAVVTLMIIISRYRYSQMLSTFLTSVTYINSLFLILFLYLKNEDFRKCFLATVKCLPADELNLDVQFDNPTHRIINDEPVEIDIKIEKPEM